MDIEGGTVKLEKVKKGFDAKRFRIGKYPVTNVQFQAFINAEDGYRNGEWWKGIKKSEQPGEPNWKEANSPRESVSWHEAVAFCKWLSKRTGSKIRLPTEWEWQLAATGGGTEREYPWPGGWDPTRCNSFESRLDRTSAVGIYPSGATQPSVLDMAGNVAEWCLNKHQQPGTPESLRIDDEVGQRVLRGGSWFNAPRRLRSYDRDRPNPDFRHYGGIGFRLAQDIE